MPNLKVQSYAVLANKIDALHRLRPEERRSIVENAGKVLTHFYVHQRFKMREGMLGHKRGLADIEADIDKMREDTFHLMVRNVFVQQADAHTLYGLPAPYRGMLAFLPIQLKHYVDESGKIRVVVARQMKGFRHPDFCVGVEVVRWTDKPVLEAIDDIGAREVGGNESAFLMNAVSRMCVRPLSFAERPQLLWERVGYLPLNGGKQREILLPWGIGSGLSPASLYAENVAEVRLHTVSGGRLVWNTDKVIAERNPEGGLSHQSSMPDLFEFRSLKGEGQDGMGYVRIRGFGHDDAMVSQEGEICAEFARILQLTMERSPNGLVLDIRGNPGGNVKAAEGMLQMLTPRAIVPARFHWRRSPAIQRVLRKARVLRAKFPNLSDSENATLLDLSAALGDWISDLDAPSRSLPEFVSSGKPVTDVDSANDTGQIYQGPVALLIDAFTYSAADIFAAGFQDHEIGPVAGVTESTGGGGATRWRYEQLIPLAKAAGVELGPLPKGVSMNVAMQRSTRVLRQEGLAVEDLGVLADAVFAPTYRDILDGGADLIAGVCGLLAKLPKYRLQIVKAWLRKGSLELQVVQQGFKKIGCEVNDRKTKLVDLGQGSFSANVAALGAASEYRIVLRGFDAKRKMVVATRKTHAVS